MSLSNKQKAAIRNTLRGKTFLSNATNIRFVVAIQQSTLSLHSLDNKLKRRIYERNCSWQEKVAWVERILENRKTGKHKGESFEHYLIVLNDEKLAREAVAKKSNRLRGKNNPAYNHGGKLSPWSEKSEFYSEEAKQKAAENRSYTTQLEYYTNQGLSEDEAKDALSERQRTFSLERCIEKYGKVDGTKIWKQRQQKWLTALDSKSDEEKAEIRAKKGTKINYQTLWNKKLDTPAILYIIQWQDNQNIKIGITSRGLKKRFSKMSRKYNVLYTTNGTISKCFEMEQIVLRKHKNLKISDPDSHECFVHTAADTIIEFVQELENMNYENLKELLRERYM